jgi:hypothetical protein
MNTTGLTLPEVAINPVAHFKFEGGSLDVYQQTSAQTLEELVKQLNLHLTDKVVNLVQKYNNYYVAVLNLDVLPIIESQKLQLLQGCMPDQMVQINSWLKTNTRFSDSQIYNEINQIPIPPACGSSAGDYLNEYVYAAVDTSSNLNGNAVSMEFAGSSFFYPTSLVQSYEYPIIDEQYYIKTPDDLDFKLKAGKRIQTISSTNDRWTQVESKAIDLEGTITSANIFVKLIDIFRFSLEFLYNTAALSGVLILLVFIIIPPILLRKVSTFSIKSLVFLAVAFFLGGFLLTSIVSLVLKKNKLALAYFGIWILSICIHLL